MYSPSTGNLFLTCTLPVVHLPFSTFGSPSTKLQFTLCSSTVLKQTVSFHVYHLLPLPVITAAAGCCCLSCNFCNCRCNLGSIAVPSGGHQVHHLWQPSSGQQGLQARLPHFGWYLPAPCPRRGPCTCATPRLCVSPKSPLTYCCRQLMH